MMLDLTKKVYRVEGDTISEIMLKECIELAAFNDLEKPEGVKSKFFIDGKTLKMWGHGAIETIEKFDNPEEAWNRWYEMYYKVYLESAEYFNDFPTENDAELFLKMIYQDF